MCYRIAKLNSDNTALLVAVRGRGKVYAHPLSLLVAWQPKTKATDVAECQICGRAIGAKVGVIAHHGYTRPGEGWQTGSCPGVRFVPYSTSRDRLTEVLAWAVKGVADWQGAIALAPEIQSLPRRKSRDGLRVDVGVKYAPSLTWPLVTSENSKASSADSDFPALLAAHTQWLYSNLRLAEGYAKFLQERWDKWSPP